MREHVVATRGCLRYRLEHAPVGPVDVNVHRVIAESDLVAVHSHYKTWNMAGVDIFRLDDDGKIIEHWDEELLDRLQAVGRTPRRSRPAGV